MNGKSSPPTIQTVKNFHRARDHRHMNPTTEQILEPYSLMRRIFWLRICATRKSLVHEKSEPYRVRIQILKDVLKWQFG